jgi:hypothetical protein
MSDKKSQEKECKNKSGFLPGSEPRLTIDLDGIWELAAGDDTPPTLFPGRIEVPGLVDLASGLEVAFTGLETTEPCWWYRRQVTVPKAMARAAIEVDAARYGVSCWLDGNYLGRHASGWTRARFDTGALIAGTHELLMKVEARRQRMAEAGLHGGHDGEKHRYIPGICDCVRLIGSATPHVVDLQAAPDTDRSWVLVEALVCNDDAVPRRVQPRLSVQGCDGQGVWEVTLAELEIPAHGTLPVYGCVPCPGIRVWSPETPVLHWLICDVGTDRASVRFGQRNFRFDVRSRRAVLNGEPIYLRGTNVCMDRFFEDPLRARLPWDRNWVRAFIRQCKWMHWNSARFTLGAPPDLWYEICDEEGLLIQDEYSIWNKTELATMQALSHDLECLVRQHANHPSVVIFDAQNETDCVVTRQAARAARRADLSDRPWDLGWDRPPMRPDDVFESHPYLIHRDDFRLDSLSSWNPEPEEARLPKDGRTGNPTLNPVIINEYSYLWINRDGSLPTLCHDNPVLEKVGSSNDAPVVERRDAMSYGIACLTGFWRMHRTVAGVMHFCSLTYSLPHGQTCDNFIDLERQELEPTFARLVRASFAPVAAILDNWGRPHCRKFPYTAHLVLVNDLNRSWRGPVTVRLRQRDDGQVIESATVEMEVEALGTCRRSVTLPGPKSAGAYLLESELTDSAGEPVVCERRFIVPDRFLGRYWS